MKKRNRSLWLVLLLTAVLALGLLTGCRKGSAQGQDNSAALHSTASEAQALQSGEEDNGRDQELILYDDDDFQDSVYAEDEEQPEEEGESVQTAAVDENGSYTTKDDVALYIHTYGKLPPNFITKKEAQKLGWSP